MKISIAFVAATVLLSSGYASAEFLRKLEEEAPMCKSGQRSTRLRDLAPRMYTIQELRQGLGELVELTNQRKSFEVKENMKLERPLRPANGFPVGNVIMAESDNDYVAAMIFEESMEEITLDLEECEDEDETVEVEAYDRRGLQVAKQVLAIKKGAVNQLKRVKLEARDIVRTVVKAKRKSTLSKIRKIALDNICCCPDLECRKGTCGK